LPHQFGRLTAQDDIGPLERGFHLGEGALYRPAGMIQRGQFVSGRFVWIEHGVSPPEVN
jgi:hypothetical protein